MQEREVNGGLSVRTATGHSARDCLEAALVPYWFNHSDGLAVHKQRKLCKVPVCALTGRTSKRGVRKPTPNRASMYKTPFAVPFHKSKRSDYEERIENDCYFSQRVIMA